MSYAGVVTPLPVGIDGFYGTRKLPITGLLRGRNLTLENNMWEKEGGAATQNATPLSGAIVAQYDWWPDAVTQRHIAVTKDGQVFRDTGAWTFGGAIVTGLTVASRAPHLVAIGSEVPGNPRKLALLTGNDPVKVGAGDFTAMANLALPPGDWAGTRFPVAGILHAGRFWALLNHTAYYSTASNHEDFTTAPGAGSLFIAGDYQYLTGGFSYRETMLVLFAYPRGIFIVDTATPTPSSWFYYQQSRSVGCPSAWGMAPIPGDDLLFLDATLNAHVLSATDVLRDAQASDVSTPKLGQWVRENLDALRGAWAHLAWFNDKKRVEIGVSGLGALVNNRRLLVDFNNRAVGPRFTVSDRDVAESLVMRIVNGIERPYLGTDGGYVVKLDETLRSTVGPAYASPGGYIGQAQTDHTDLGELVPGFAGRRKNFDYLEIEIQGVGNYSLSINVYIDGLLKTPLPLTVSLAGAGVPLGTFLLGTDRLAERFLRRVRRQLPWSGERISIEMFNQGAGETFQIPRAWIGARLGD
jgi:hypothetical protein